MKKQHIYLFLLMLLMPIGISAQTLEQAKTMFNKKQYDTAKPVFKQYAKANPSNANYNYWYAVCCLKTGEAALSIKPLELAVQRKIQNAPFFLGQAYHELWQFEKAVKHYEAYIETLKKKKSATDEVEKLLEESKLCARMLKGVEEVCVIDSFIVEKADFLKTYKISEESGKLHKYEDFFKTNTGSESIVYESELGNVIYYSELGEDSTLNIFSNIKMQDGWGTPAPFPDTINQSANVNYPFVLTDGITIYYASDGEGSIGGYDIFVTRYNSANNSYLTSENIGMPFNSPFNDYMYVIDEFNNLGWFASDRYQPEDTVCIYVFIPNKFKKIYNYESTNPDLLISLARLGSLSDTWKDETVTADARERLKNILNRQPSIERKAEFVFVIDDQKTYNYFEEFKSPRAKQVFEEYCRLKDNYRIQTEKLNKQREQYARAGKEERAKLSHAIPDLEKRIEEMSEEINKLAIKVRYEEKQNIKR